jgi:hypothetical protein
MNPKQKKRTQIKMINDKMALLNDLAIKEGHKRHYHAVAYLRGEISGLKRARNLLEKGSLEISQQAGP